MPTNQPVELPLPVQPMTRLGEQRSRTRSAYNQASVGLAYGRHAGPVPGDARQAAVLIMLAWDGAQWNLPLTKRPTSLRHHGGQICFPGGRLEAGESAVEAAVREFDEELGMVPDDLQILGRLSTMHVYASHNVVTPIVATTRQTMQFRLDPVEVAQAIMLPWDALTDESRWTMRSMRRAISRNREVVDSFTFRYRALQFGEHLIWGATAMMLAELCQVGYR
ncbi:NUDIX hydrolase [Rosistilla oblonga]|uniref:NUDIX hydrolase n=1 Tax=Rosistilla oblonga TaxID=2527990 RepID=UPI003A970C6D